MIERDVHASDTKSLALTSKRPHANRTLATAIVCMRRGGVPNGAMPERLQRDL